MTTFICPSCNGDTGVELGSYENIGLVFPCPKCGKVYEVEYDECWEDGDDEELCYWWLQPLPT